MSQPYSLTIADSLHSAEAAAWLAWSASNPFVSPAFLQLLQASGAVGEHAGWKPFYVLLHQDGVLVAAAPCYVKNHSWGEYVFDQVWARAFAEHGLAYYPKLVVASPFTPVQGPRLLAEHASARQALAEGLLQLCGRLQVSSVHVLFAAPEDMQALQQAGFMLRQGVQFHWRNAGYANTEQFLAQLTHDKRKKMRQDSRYVAQAGIRYRWLEGAALRPSHLRFFYACYVRTYAEHGSQPYLSEAFFQQAHAQDALQFVLMLAERDGEPVACALNVRSGDRLYGRYWGSMEFVRGLHFETCYMQSIAYCIAHGLQVFEGGAQGEHKMARGLLPVATYSAHYIAESRFARAIADFLQQEQAAVASYQSELGAATPFKADFDDSETLTSVGLNVGLRREEEKKAK